jgi:hypothetical protein
MKSLSLKVSSTTPFSLLSAGVVGIQDVDPVTFIPSRPKGNKFMDYTKFKILGVDAPVAGKL